MLGDSDEVNGSARSLALTEDRLRILHVVPYYPPDRIGGVGEVVAHLHRAMLAQGHESRVLTTGESQGDSTVVRIPGGPSRFVLGCWRYLILAREADVVNVHHGEALALISLMKLRRVGTPILLTLHMSPGRLGRAFRSFRVQGNLIGRGISQFGMTTRMTVRQCFDRLAMVWADRLCFISRSASSDVLPAERVEEARVIYNGLPAQRAEVDGSPAKPVELLFVGRPNIAKRIHTLPFILAHVREEWPGCRMRVVGFSAEDDREFLKWARSLNVLDAFVFEGRLRSEQLPRFYQAAQVLLVPSAYEGLPMVILEGYQNGLPCVATRVGGHPEIVKDGYNGYLVDVDRPEQMAKAALHLLNDPSLRRRMGALGRAFVAERFGVERQVREYLELYREMLFNDA